MKKFKKIYIETTNVCNLSCSFCPKTTRTNQFMKASEFEVILQNIQAHTNYIYLHVLGEPLLNKELPMFLNLAKKYQIAVNITTNATLLNKCQEVLLHSESLRQLNISLHSFEANDVQFTMNDYVQQVTNFVNEAKKTNLIVSIRLWNMDKDEIRGENTLNEDIISMLQHQLQPDVSIRESLLEKQSVKLFDRIYLNMAHKFEWPDSTREVLSQQMFCHGLRDHVGILADGSVVPCCLDSEGSIVLGNIFETPLQQIVESERAVAMYEGFSNRIAVEALCQRCGYATRY